MSESFNDIDVHACLLWSGYKKNLLLLVCPSGSDFVVEPLIVLKVPEDLKLLHHVKVTADVEESNVTLL